MRSTVVQIEWARLEGRRPRKAGCNARLGEHGWRVAPGIARLTTEDGVTGFGWSHISRSAAEQLVGFELDDAFQPGKGVAEAYRELDYPIWDLIGQMEQKPVYAMLDHAPSDGSPRVPCYDTSIYMDDLHLTDHAMAAGWMAAEAQQGYDQGHRAFKIKVGRGAMHMPLDEGTERDIAVIRAVREVVGPECPILLDANNGYNLNLTKRVLAETAEVGIYWMEEPFHEDPSLYANLRRWMDDAGLETLIADGEGDASTRLLDWVRQGLIDVVQYDILQPGLTRWAELGSQLDQWGALTAPHHYGGHYGNYAASHLGCHIRGFQFVEWDEANTPGLDTSSYRILEGRVQVPDLPGFGLRLEEDIFARAVQENGFRVSSV